MTAPRPDDSLAGLLTGLAERAGSPVTLEVYADADHGSGCRDGHEVTGSDGRAYGCLRMPSGGLRVPREAVTSATRLIGERLERQRAARSSLDRRAVQVRSLLDRGGLQMLYQPIMRLYDAVPVGVEALARFPGRPNLGPDRWFADAAAVGLGEDLEIAAVLHAVDELAGLPADVYLSLNVSPSTAASSRLRNALGGSDLGRLVFEITEHAEITDYEALNRALRPLRRDGLRIAVDDAGAGFASLRHILRMAPDIIKLDRSLTTGIDRDSVLRALSYSVASFASATDAAVVAEGIESGSELDALRFLGIAYGQGYHLHRPAAAETVIDLALAAFSHSSAG